MLLSALTYSLANLVFAITTLPFFDGICHAGFPLGFINQPKNWVNRNAQLASNLQPSRLCEPICPIFVFRVQQSIQFGISTAAYVQVQTFSCNSSSGS